MAAYGRASCLLAFAKRSAAEGKSGLAYNELLQGISCILDNLVSEEINLDGSLLSYSSEFGCALKLLGDLFSLGAILPPDVFKPNRETFCSQKESIVKNEVRNNLYDEQIAFVAKGEAAYETSSSLISAQLLGDEERIATAAIACDLGTNHLLQARLLSSSFTEGSGGLTQTSLNDMSKISEIEDKLKKSSNSFRAAISANEVVAPAWCGLGCALSGTDPLLAQHCFSRSIELDGTFPDAWANLGLLYAERGAQVACDLALDGLTQVADTPLMWICRGLILETKSSVMSEAHDSDFLKAADAYRAALQVSNHPSALLGLALTCRRLGIDSETSHVGPGEKYTEAAKAMAMTESMVNMDLYQSQTGGSNVGSTIVKGLLAIEESIKRVGLPGVELFQDGKQNLLRAKETFAMLRSEKPDDEMISCDLALKSTYPDDCMPFSDASSAIDATFFTVSYDPATNEHESDRFTNIALNALDAAQRKLHENPDNGFYWFCLAKEYIVFVNNHKKVGLSDSQMYATMQNAMIAVTKAEMLLQKELVHVSLLTATRPLNNFVENNKGSPRYTSVAHKPSIPESLSCSLMADALSLKYLIYKLGIMQTSRMWDDNNIDCGLESSAKIAIQKSIMIDPENSIARAGFDLMLNAK
uniref:Uncharacterized protein n=2 Tax=Proboscia inermis TaxID=420281 RepID=A0A7S0GD35_9STRA|mmetsp:Transcript_35521/g.35726  ORF Transcript_35521/g.35726 Transcript_35521/m.35726 type:complete len:644 (+) Transcript_35521:360-2291(+)